MSGSHFSTYLTNVISPLRPATSRGAARSYFRRSLTPEMASNLVTSSSMVTISLELRLMGHGNQLIAMRDAAYSFQAMRMKLRV